MKAKLNPDQRRYLGKVHHKCMNNDDIGILKTDAWTADTIRSLKADGSPECLAAAAILEAVYGPYHLAVTSKRVERDEGTMNVDAFREEQKSLTGKLKMLEANVMVAMPLTFAPVLKNLDLDNIKIYNKGAQAEQVLSLEVLQIKITNIPEISAFVTSTTAMIEEVKDVYEKKETQFKSIKKDATNVLELKSAVGETMLKVFGKLTDIFSATPAKVMDFFNLEIVTDDIRSEDFLYVNQFALQGYQGTIINADIVDFEHDNWITVDCEGPLAIDIYLSSVIDNIIPIIAQRIESGTSKTFALDTIGASTQRKLMAAIATDAKVTEPCKFKITVIKKKK